MILQALKEYYDRKAVDPQNQMAPEGWEWKEIPFVIVLSPQGQPVSIEDTREGTGKNRRAKTFLVPQAVIRGNDIVANRLWDNVEYALGVTQRSKPERVVEQHNAFRGYIISLDTPSEPAVNALLKFLDWPDKASDLASRFPQPWQELLDTPGANVAFRMATDAALIANRPAVSAAIDDAAAQQDASKGFCLITGVSEQPICRLHPVIKGIWGAQSTGANLVSFQKNSGYDSYGKEQGRNAPISRSAAFAYATALNHLLGKDSRQRLQVGDASTVFWADRATEFETQVSAFFSEPPKDDPDRNVEAVRALHASVKNGSYAISDKDTRFYVLGLAPNAKRASIRFWHVGTVPEMAARFSRHFEDTHIVHGPRDADALSLFRLLVATAVQGKAENIPPNLGGDTMRAILEGTPYPMTLLEAALRRTKAEHEVSYPRAALIKACINREVRYRSPAIQEELKMALDPDNSSIGYRLGRLFATLEKIQQEANPGINATIRDRFYGAASSTPVTVFGNLMRLKNHHLAKLSDGLRILRERLIGEIISGIADFPAHLALADQGRFAIGYYHQMQDFYTKKTDDNQ